MGGLDCRAATDGTNLATHAMPEHDEKHNVLIGVGLVHGRRILCASTTDVKHDCQARIGQLMRVGAVPIRTEPLEEFPIPSDPLETQRSDLFAGSL